MQPCHDFFRIDRRCAVTALNEEVFVSDNVGDLFVKVVLEEQVAHTDGLFHVFIAVNRCDAASGRAIGLAGDARQAFFLEFIEFHMIRKNDGSAIADF